MAEPFLLDPMNRAVVEGGSRSILRLGNLGAWFWLFALTPAALAVAVAAGLTVWHLRREQALATRGAHATGVIESRRFDSDRDDPRWIVRFRFSPAPGAPQQSVEQEVLQEQYAGFTEGKEVVVRYIPDEPEVAQVVHIERGVSVAGVLWTLAGFAFVLLLGLPALLDILRNRRLARGVLVQGRVVRAGLSAERRLRIDYEFDAPNGATLTGFTAATRPDLEGARLPAPGERVSVIYASARNHRVL